MELYISEIKLSGKDKFSEDFNYISDLYAAWQADQSDESWAAYAEAKYRLEMGLPV